MSLSVRNGSFGHTPARPLFRGMNFDLAAGEIMAVLGPNGAGKTTLLNAITGIMPWQDGETYVHGKPLTDYSQRDLWQKIGYVPQARTNAFSYTVLDMLLLGRAAHLGTFARPGPNDYTLARKVLDRLEIRHLENAYCNAISGGELQLVFIGRALVGEPDILFLDEPESHLDFKKQLIILDIIDSLAHEDGLICVMNTHFPNHALRIADKVLLLGNDRDHHCGPAQTILSEDAIRTCFGVNAAISDITADGLTYKSIYPLSLNHTHAPQQPMAS